MRATQSVLRLGRLRVRELNQLVGDLEIAEANLLTQIERLDRESAAASGLVTGRVRMTSSSDEAAAGRRTNMLGSLTAMQERLRNSRADLAKARDDLSRIENLAELTGKSSRRGARSAPGRAALAG